MAAARPDEVALASGELLEAVENGGGSGARGEGDFGRVLGKRVEADGRLGAAQLGGG